MCESIVYRDTRNNTSSPVIFLHLLPAPLLTIRFPISLFLLSRQPCVTSTSSGAHSAPAAVDRELNERAGSPRIGHAISARGYRVIWIYNRVCHSSLQQPAEFRDFRYSGISRIRRVSDISKFRARRFYSRHLDLEEKFMKNVHTYEKSKIFRSWKFIKTPEIWLWNPQLRSMSRESCLVIFCRPLDAVSDALSWRLLRHWNAIVLREAASPRICIYARGLL